MGEDTEKIFGVIVAENGPNWTGKLYTSKKLYELVVG